MIATEFRSVRLPALLGGLLAACLLPGAGALAQEGDGGRGAGDGVDTGRPPAASIDRRDPIEADPLATASNADTAATGPVRLARFSFVGGNVTWRADSADEWSKAAINLPIRQGAQVWVTDGGHAELQFDDGSELRLGSGALATLKTLYSDKDGEFTQISLSDGLATLHARHDDAVYQLDTPFVSVKSHGVSQIRVGVDNGSEVTVQHGEAVVEGSQGKATLRAGDYLYLADAAAPFKIQDAPQSDSWDQWNGERNDFLEKHVSKHVPSNIGLVAGDLDSYGDWHNDATYGEVWSPRDVSPDWRPYYDGRWTYCDPFGWTWVGAEPWGWAPYHYGSWVHLSFGWGWCPGPVRQFWSPAVVSFSVYDGCVAWAPLCPSEVVYPAGAFGFWGPDWAFSFSIGCAGVFYPRGGFCVGRPFNNHFVNFFSERGRGFDHRDFARGSGSAAFDRFARTNEFAAANSHFVPFNASHAKGASFARLDSFGGSGRYQPLSTANTSFFSRGRVPAAPGAGQGPVAGPPSVAPTAIARTPSRSFTATAPPQSALQRSLYHAPIALAPRSGAAGRTLGPTSPPASGRTGGSASALGGGRTGIGGSSAPGSARGSADTLRSARDAASAGSVGSRTSGAGDRGLSGADAARAARSSLGLGRSPYIYDSGTVPDRAARGGSGALTPRSGASGSGSAGRTYEPGSSGRTYDPGRTVTPRSGETGGSRTYGEPELRPGRTYGGAYDRTERSTGGAYGRSDSGSSGTYGRSESGSYGRSGGYYVRPDSGSYGRSGGSYGGASRSEGGSSSRSGGSGGSGGSSSRSDGGSSGGRSGSSGGSRSR